MPFRTRDFAIFLGTVSFLVLGILTTIHNDITSKDQTAALIATEVSNEEVVYKAVLPEPAPDERTSRLATLRAKIGDMISADAKEPEEVPVPAVVEEGVVTTGTIVLCSSYAPHTSAWGYSGLKFEVVEGARLAYLSVVVPAGIDEFGSSTEASITKDVKLQLPLRTFPLVTKTCLTTDVVGIALDSSLISNSDYTAYGIFGGETLVGYALDGFPIYGKNDALKTDECGGAVVGGEYRYYISSARDGVLGCFGGEPITL